MKIRTRILTAVLATATAFSCALTASAAAPTITLDNSTMPAMAKDGVATATLTLKSSDFKDVTGAKIKITLPGGVTLESAKITDGTWVEDQDYQVKGNTVTLVNVFNLGGNTATDLSLNLNVTVSKADIGSYPITVSGEYADTNVVKQTITETESGNLVISKAEKNALALADATTEITQLDTTQYFIPYGGVYSVVDNKIKYYDKTDVNSFDLSQAGENKVSVLKCKLPADGEDVTTFGFAKKDADETAEKDYDKQNGLQFGTYAKQGTGKSYGTLLIMGDYSAFKTAIGAATDDAALQAIVAKYDNTVDTKDTVNAGDAVTFTKGTNKITVKKVAQTKKMWSNENYLQYAIRLIGLVNGKTYTAAGYSLEGNAYNFSAEVQSKLNPFTAE